MFTGIVTSRAVLREREKKKTKGSLRLTFEILGKSPRFQLGQSLAVDGACVTVAGFRGKKFSVDLIDETLRSTTLGKLSPGRRVNLECSLHAGDALGGHWVTGHVDGIGIIQKISRRDGSLQFEISAPRDIRRYLVNKGSVTIDGISFTIQEIRRGSFVIGVTPHTFRVTTLSWKREGDRVNLEADHFAKLVKHFVSNGAKKTFSFNIKTLQAQGF